MLRKFTPYLLFAGLGLCLLTGHGLLESVTTWLYGAGSDAGVKRTLYPIGAINGLANWN